jgi:hypothetical protein
MKRVHFTERRFKHARAHHTRVGRHYYQFASPVIFSFIEQYNAASQLHERDQSAMGRQSYKTIPVDEFHAAITELESLTPQIRTLRNRLNAEIEHFERLMVECSPDVLTEFVNALPDDSPKFILQISLGHYDSIRESKRWKRNCEKRLSECLLSARLVTALQRADPPILTLGQVADMRATDLLKIDRVSKKGLQTLYEILRLNGFNAARLEQDIF